jgi:hypothetical protein
MLENYEHPNEHTPAIFLLPAGKEAASETTEA